MDRVKSPLPPSLLFPSFSDRVKAMCSNSDAQEASIQRMMEASVQSVDLLDLHLSGLGMANSSTYGSLWERVVKKAGIPAEVELAVVDLCIVRKSYWRILQAINNKEGLKPVKQFLLSHCKQYVLDSGTEKFPIVNILSANPSLSVVRFIKLSIGLDSLSGYVAMLFF